jgi:hypothetical protein
MVSMSAALNDEVRLGQHIASFAEDASAQLDLLAPTFRTALASECQGLFIADRTPPEAFIAGLAERGCDVESAIETGQFVLLTSEETYLQGGYFDAERQLGMWDDTIAAAHRAGFAGVFASGEVTWLDRVVPGVDRWLEYEFRVNLIEERDFVGLACLYRENGLPKWAEAELVKTHPLIHRDGQVRASGTFVADEARIADVPLLEDMEPSADRVPCAMLAVLLSAYADGELHPRRRAEIAAHIEQCPKCAEAAQRHRQLKSALSGLRVPRAAPESFWEEVSRQWAEDRPDEG